jgi:hypothetical protein
MQNLLVPEQTVGSKMDAQSEIRCGSLTEAILFYQVTKKRLFDINNWDKTSGTSATCFQLTKPNGEATGEIAEGYLIRIDIPGPGTLAGDGYDWVRIEKIEEQTEGEFDEWAGFTVRPCENPLHPDLGTAHFFSESATSTFLIKRTADRVSAEMHGRNEVPNGKVDGVFDGLRNAMVGWTAKVGLSYPQWKLLVEGLVKPVD